MWPLLILCLHNKLTCCFSSQYSNEDINIRSAAQLGLFLPWHITLSIQSSLSARDWPQISESILRNSCLCLQLKLHLQQHIRQICPKILLLWQKHNTHHVIFQAGVTQLLTKRLNKAVSTVARKCKSIDHFIDFTFLTVCFQATQRSAMHFTSTPTARGRAEPSLWRTCMWCLSSEVQYTVSKLNVLLLLLSQLLNGQEVLSGTWDLSFREGHWQSTHEQGSTGE